jgi:hypothetical protein
VARRWARYVQCLPFGNAWTAHTTIIFCKASSLTIFLVLFACREEDPVVIQRSDNIANRSLSNQTKTWTRATANRPVYNTRRQQERYHCRPLQGTRRALRLRPLLPFLTAARRRQAIGRQGTKCTTLAARLAERLSTTILVAKGSTNTTRQATLGGPHRECWERQPGRLASEEVLRVQREIARYDGNGRRGNGGRWNGNGG